MWVGVHLVLGTKTQRIWIILVRQLPYHSDVSGEVTFDSLCYARLSLSQETLRDISSFFDLELLTF